MAPHIQALKLFHDNDQLHVAIFAEPTESSDGWLRNFSWNEVFVYPPDSLASEELIPLEHIRYSFTFQPAFVAEWLIAASESTPPSPASPGSASRSIEKGSGPSKPVSLAQYCNRIAKLTGLAPEVVRKCCEPLLAGLAKQINSGIPFASWILTGTPGEEPSIPSADGQPARPGRKYMRMEVSKQYRKRK